MHIYMCTHTYGRWQKLVMHTFGIVCFTITMTGKYVYICMYAYMYVCMYVCLYVCTCVICLGLFISWLQWWVMCVYIYKCKWMYVILRSWGKGTQNTHTYMQGRSWGKGRQKNTYTHTHTHTHTRRGIFALMGKGDAFRESFLEVKNNKVSRNQDKSKLSLGRVGMCVCVCVCIYVCMIVCMCVCMYVWIIKCRGTKINQSCHWAE
jgi:hypothetical protein